ncbi:MAG: hypothetical protein A2X36_01085 [Elusimicrobia bacterium GWA2_69_24]|nr:MAG: hypothetical protein A2X36_01085 [Elusimicrobia bacterium GWA2_69_24]HBL16461.1 response regulator [Elusimicrobiota bacterium]
MGSAAAKILIVDDDEDYVAAVRAVLRHASFEVVSAGDMEGGFSMLEEEQPDLLILDMMMGGKGAGFLFSRKMRKDPRFQALPVLMLTGMREQTGFSFPGKDKDPKWLPVDDFAEKPLKPDELLRRVERLLKKAQESAQ